MGFKGLIGDHTLGNQDIDIEYFIVKMETFMYCMIMIQVWLLLLSLKARKQCDVVYAFITVVFPTPTCIMLYTRVWLLLFMMPFIKACESVVCECWG